MSSRERGSLASGLRRNCDGEERLILTNVTQGTELGHSVEMAARGARRRRGLLGRDGLGAGEGLWIVPCEAVHTIGMRFAIDLVYLDRKQRVRKVCASVPPGRMSACLTAQSVVEFPAGTIARTHTRAGDQVVFAVAPGAGEMRPLPYTAADAP